MWDLVPWPGIELRPPALRTWSLSHWTIRKVPNIRQALDGQEGTDIQRGRAVRVEGTALGWWEDAKKDVELREGRGWLAAVHRAEADKDKGEMPRSEPSGEKLSYRVNGHCSLGVMRKERWSKWKKCQCDWQTEDPPLGPALGLQRAQNGLLSSQMQRHLTCKSSKNLRSSPLPGRGPHAEGQ